MRNRTAFSSSSLSIRQVLNTLAGRRDEEDSEQKDGSQGNNANADRPAPEEISQWIETNPEILGLYKTYLDARAEYLGILTAHGKDSPLCEVAADRADSAWCLLETRIYELRMDRAAAARIALTRQLEEDAERARISQRKQRIEKENDFKASRHSVLQKTIRQNRKKYRDFLLFWYWCRFVLGAQTGIQKYENKSTAFLVRVFATA